MLSRLSAYGGKANQYDAIKAVALLAMTADHIGWLFFPEIDALRAVGRLAMPLFAFLIGFHADKPLHPRLWVWAAAYELASIALGQAVFPLNILFALALAHYVAHGCEKKGWVEKQLIGLWLAIVLFSVPLMVLVEFGAMTWGFALVGVMVRRGLRDAQHRLFGLALAMVFIVQQTQFYQLGLWVVLGAALALLIIIGWLFARFSPLAAIHNFKAIDIIVRFFSRYSLEYYVLHLLLLQLLALYMKAQPWQWQFRWLS